MMDMVKLVTKRDRIVKLLAVMDANHSERQRFKEELDRVRMVITDESRQMRFNFEAFTPRDSSLGELRSWEVPY